MARLAVTAEQIEPRAGEVPGARPEPRPLVVRVADLSVRLSLQRERVTTLRERVIRFLERRSVETEAFWPVRNVSFEVRRGEVFGIAGRNGAGKSTLLKVIAGVIAPTLGRVEVHGRIAPLLELGAGFDPEMTGRENIFLYGSLLGFPRRRLLERFDHIVEFAELEDFIDVPLKNYSSGMSARLGFAVATDVDADLLIVDETLTVGDARFQLKCMERIEDFRNRGMSILFVSHSLEQMRRLCSSALWLDNGDVRSCGPAEEVLGAYAASELDRPTAHHAFAPPTAVAAVSAAAPVEERGVASGAYDFIDIATHDPNSALYCSRRFGGVGIGISNRPAIVEGYRRLGVDAHLVDPLELDLPENCVGYVSLMDSLHFFREPQATEQLLARASRWARDFVFVRMPSFEDDAYLRALGLKFTWCDWTRPVPRRLDQLALVLQALGLEQYHVTMRQPTLSSDAPTLLPVGAPPDQLEYSPAVHGPKPSIEFPRPVYAQIDLFVALRGFDPEEWRQIVTCPV